MLFGRSNGAPERGRPARGLAAVKELLIDVAFKRYAPHASSQAPSGLERDLECELSGPRHTSGRSRLSEQRVAVDRVPIEPSVGIHVEYFDRPGYLDLPEP